MSTTLHTEKRFFLYLSIITIAGFFIRVVNINYASLWADELYSMLSVHPGNSWYEILYMQRTYQPPAYFMMLWGWVSVIGYNEFAGRLLSVIGGTLAILASAFLGKRIQGEKLGLLMAIIVAFNPTQIFYSLEARFYIFTYVVASICLWLHWHLLTNRPKHYFLYYIQAGVCALLCYFHHFGIFFVFGLFIHDLIVFNNDRERMYFYRKLSVYVLSALIYSPWFFWGLLQGLSTTQFWLKDIDLWKYFTFSMGYPAALNIVLSLAILFFIFHFARKKEKYFGLFPVIVLAVTIIPLLYSIFRIPILVDRYGMVMAPAIYLMLGISILNILKWLKNKIAYRIAIVLLAIIFMTPGINLSLVNKDPLKKQPWREMAHWLKKQPDIQETNVYSLGIYLKGRFTIEFYLEPEKKPLPISELRIGKDQKMYLVETSSVWKIDDKTLNEIGKAYEIKVISFQRNSPDFGNIYLCAKK